MKNYPKTKFNTAIIGAIALTLTSVFFISCGSENSEKPTDSTIDSTGGHTHTYSCPMHPEVVGAEGEKCPKCGMTLVHSDHSENQNEYKMNFASSVAVPSANQEVTLSFTPTMVGNENASVALDVVHDKKIHLIIVNKDLSWFDHIHPEYNADGSYTVAEKFPAAGEYTLFADYTPTGGVHQLEKINLTVSGQAVAEVPLFKERLTGEADGYEVVISSSDGFATNRAVHMGAVVKKDGKELVTNDYENYLGAKAHVVIIGYMTMEYMHVHPEFQNGMFDLHTTFTKPGIYKGWFQFQTNGQVHITDFVLNVKEGAASEGHDEESGHNHGDHQH